MKRFTKRAAQRVSKAFGYKLVPIQNEVETWPHKVSVPVDAPTLFIFTPPNSGSTAISKYLTSRENIASYNPNNCEMQWLVPGLRGADRWFSKKAVSYQSVCGVINRRIAEIQDQDPSIQYFVEKSPANMVRHEKLLHCFPNRKIIINNRDPFANIASQSKRYSSTRYEGLESDEKIRHLADLWVFRSKLLCEIQDAYDAPIVTYEDFCKDPEVVFEAFGIQDTAPSGATHVQVKDYAPQPIRNMNAEQRALLSEREVHIVREVLSEHSDVLRAFNYEL